MCSQLLLVLKWGIDVHEIYINGYAHTVVPCKMTFYLNTCLSLLVAHAVKKKLQSTFFLNAYSFQNKENVLLIVLCNTATLYPFKITFW